MTGEWEVFNGTGYNRKERQPLFRYINIFLKNLKKFVRIWLLLSLYIVEGKRERRKQCCRQWLGRPERLFANRYGLHQTACGTAATSRSFPAINISAESAADRSRLLSEKNRQIEGINRKEIP